MNFPIPSESLTPARRSELLKEAGFTERDIPSEWRIPEGQCSHPLCDCRYRCKYEPPRKVAQPEGIIIEPLTPQQSDAIELDRR